jgi:hypothetical protein
MASENRRVKQQAHLLAPADGPNSMKKERRRPARMGSLRCFAVTIMHTLPRVCGWHFLCSVEGRVVAIHSENPCSRIRAVQYTKDHSLRSYTCCSSHRCKLLQSTRVFNLGLIPLRA